MNHRNNAIIDYFCGSGGASTGIELATGLPVTIAVNHAAAAILLHETNHPFTKHLHASVWDVDPAKECEGMHVHLAWFSPDCKHFSKASGAALRDHKIRGLAWVECRVAAQVRPDIMITENVEEFLGWGPLNRRHHPIKSKKGQTFKKWCSQLEELGYILEWQILNAADYGAPTSRKRLVIIARCDGKPIVWPKRTHAPRGSKEVRSGICEPWRSAAEIIDWSRPCPSIFDSKAQILEQYGLKAVRPLADNTLRRVIRGVDKFTIKSGEPFLIPTGYGEHSKQAPRVHDISDPVPTIVAQTVKHAVCEPLFSPFLADCNHSGGGHINGVDNPIGTITSKCTTGAAASLLSPVTFSNTNGSVGFPTSWPVHTITSDGKQVLSSAQLIQYHTEQRENVRAAGLDAPINTVDASNRYGLIAATLVEYYGNGRPLNIAKPLHTATSHDREALTTANLVKFYGGVIGADVDEPLPTVTSVDHNALTLSHICKFKGTNLGQSLPEPLQTITAQSNPYAKVDTIIVKYAPDADLRHWPKIRALLNKYCGYQLTDDEVILLHIGNAWYFIADIGLRMLTPRELHDAQGFPHDFQIDYDYLGNPYPKSEQVARVGNSVSPPMAAAIVRALWPEVCVAIDLRTMAEWRQKVAEVSA